MARSAGSVIFILRAASPIAPSKQADQPAAKSCSGLVPLLAVPGDESLTSRRPSELRDAPSRPPVVWVLAVYSTFPTWVIGGLLAKTVKCIRLNRMRYTYGGIALDVNHSDLIASDIYR